MRFSTCCVLAAVFLVADAASSRADDYVVTNTNASGPGSFAQAITDANARTGMDRIVFNIPGSGVQRIDLSGGPLPAITDGVVIDGYSQPGASANTLAVGDNARILIWLDAGGATYNGVDGLTVNSADCMAQGLSITGCRYRPDPPRAIVGGNAINSTRANTMVQGNFIGLAPDGTAAPNDTAIWFHSDNGTAGGTSPAARNLIAGCSGNAVVINTFASVLGNYIGTDATGTNPIPNNVGIAIENPYADSSTSPSLIGGTVAGSGNLISGNGTAIMMGASIPYTTASGSRAFIKGNLIGVQSDGVSPLPNQSSILIVFGSDNIIGGTEPGAGNVIAYNGAGVIVNGYSGFGNSYRNSIFSNSIYENVGPQIDLGGDGPTPNDTFDTDDGANHLQNYPVLTRLTQTADSFTLEGSLNSTPDMQFMLQLFAEAPSATRPEQVYLGLAGVNTDGNGYGTFSASFPRSALPDASATFNATATNPASGETSEFSPNEFPAPTQLENISTRAKVLAGDDAMIGGFILSTDRAVVLRALGPSLASKDIPAGECLADPTLQLFDSNGVSLASDDNWQDDAAAAARLQMLKLAPPNESESAILSYLTKGAYTAVLRGRNDSTGIALFEAYDVSSVGSGQPVNLSTRGFVAGGNDVLIGGFILVEPGTTQIVVRGLGPSLINAGVKDALLDPTLELHDGNGTLIRSDDDWRDSQETEIINTTLAPTNDKEAAIYAALPAGYYTAIVAGKNGATGVALVEIYNLL